MLSLFAWEGSRMDIRLMKQNKIQDIKYFANNQMGVTSIEYALVAFLIAVVIISSVQLLGNSVLALYDDVAGKILAVVASVGL